jgi:hypothetical protein
MLNWRALLSLTLFVLTQGVQLSAASAQELSKTGKDLVEACRALANGVTPTAVSAVQIGTCLGEIKALNWLAPGVADPNLRSCVPANVTDTEMAGTIVNYLDGNPDRLREPFQGLALQALAGTWPCPKPRGWFSRWFQREPDE